MKLTHAEYKAVIDTLVTSKEPLTQAHVDFILSTDTLSMPEPFTSLYEVKLIKAKKYTGKKLIISEYYEPNKEYKTRAILEVYLEVLVWLRGKGVQRHFRVADAKTHYRTFNATSLVLGRFKPDAIDNYFHWSNIVKEELTVGDCIRYHGEWKDKINNGN